MFPNNPFSCPLVNSPLLEFLGQFEHNVVVTTRKLQQLRLVTARLPSREDDEKGC